MWKLLPELNQQPLLYPLNHTYFCNNFAKKHSLALSTWSFLQLDDEAQFRETSIALILILSKLIWHYLSM